MSVVICTCNHRELLARALDWLRHQSSSDFEGIVVDGPSADGTKKVLAAHAPGTMLVHNTERNLSKSQNLGINAIGGDNVAYIVHDALGIAMCQVALHAT